MIVPRVSVEKGRVSFSGFGAGERGNRDEDICDDSAEAQQPFFLKLIWGQNGMCLLADLLYYQLFCSYASYTSHQV